MNSPLHITAVVDRPFLLEDLVEKLALRRNDFARPKQKVVDHWFDAATSSVETYMDGSIAFKEGDEVFQVPFTTPFLFTCRKTEAAHYKLNWALSLS